VPWVDVRACAPACTHPRRPVRWSARFLCHRSSSSNFCLSSCCVRGHGGYRGETSAVNRASSYSAGEAGGLDSRRHGASMAHDGASGARGRPCCTMPPGQSPQAVRHAPLHGNLKQHPVTPPMHTRAPRWAFPSLIGAQSRRWGCLAWRARSWTRSGHDPRPGRSHEVSGGTCPTPADWQAGEGFLGCARSSPVRAHSSGPTCHLPLPLLASVPMAAHLGA